MIVTFFPRGRGRQAKRAGGRQAAEAAHHRAQRARIEGDAPAHLAAPQTLLVHVAADAESCARGLRTAMEITLIAASCTVSDVSDGLPKRRNEQRRRQHALSADTQAALQMWQWRKK